MLLYIHFFSFFVITYSIISYAADPIKRIKPNEIEPMEAIQAIPVLPLQHIVGGKILDSVLDSLDHSKLTQKDVDTLRDWHVDIQKHLKDALFKKYPHRLEAAQCEEVKLLFDLQSYDYQELEEHRLWIGSGNTVRSLDLSNNSMTVFDLSVPAGSRVRPNVNHENIYYCGDALPIGTTIYKYDIKNKNTEAVITFPPQQKVLEISYCDNGRFMVEYKINKQRSVMLYTNGLNIFYPNKRLYGLYWDKRYGCCIDTDVQQKGDSVNLYCVDIYNGKFKGPFLHEDDLSRGELIAPSISNDGILVTVIKNACHIHDIKTENLIKIIKFDHPISRIRRCSTGENLISLLLETGRHSVLLFNPNTLTYRRVFEEPDMPFTYFKPSQHLDMFYTNLGIYSAGNQPLLILDKDIRWIGRSRDTLIFKQRKGSEHCRFYSYTTHLSLSDASLADLLTLLMVAQQKKSSSGVQKEALNVLNQSESDRIRTIAARYIAKNG